METMEEINVNTRDEYGLKAGGILCALEKFETYFTLAPCCMDSFYLVVQKAHQRFFRQKTSLFKKLF